MPSDRLAIALEASGVGVWDWRIDTGDVWWSPNLSEVLGVPAAAIDGSLEAFLALVHPDDHAQVRDALACAFERGGAFESEFRVQSASGDTRWFRSQGRVSLDANGKPSRLIGALLDLTGRRASEAAELAFGAIARASDDAIISVNLDGVVTAWNLGAERLYGYSAAEMVGHRIHRIIPPDRQGDFETIVNRLLQGERVSNVEAERLTKDGPRKFVSISSGLLVDAEGRAFGAATISRDITERKREEQWQRFLADASSLLGGSLDIGQTLDSLAHLCTAALADWCTVHLRGTNDDAEVVAIAHRDPAREAWARAVSPRIPYDPNAPRGVPNVLRTGKPELFPVIDDNLLVQAIEDPQTLKIFREARLSSAIIVPMIARGEVLGAISIYAAQPGRHFTESDLAMSLNLAGRAAQAVDNASSFAKATAAERQLRLIADNLPALVSYVDREGRYRFVNQRYADWFGMPGDRLVGRPIAELLGTEDYRKVQDRLRQGLTGAEVSYDVEVEYPAAGRRHVDVRYVPDIDENGTPRGLVSLIVDAGDRIREQRRASTLQRLTETVASAVSARDVAARMVGEGRLALEASAASVAVLDADTGTLTVIAVEGFPADVVIGTTFSVNDGTAFGMVAATGEPIMMSTWEERLRLFPHHERVVVPENRGAFAAVPLVADGSTIGVMLVAYTDEREFEPHDRDFLLTLANIGAQSLDRARLFDVERLSRERAEAESDRQALLAEAGELLAAGLGNPPELEPVARLLTRELADWCAIDLLDSADLVRECVVHRDPARAEAAQLLRTRYPVLEPQRAHTIWHVLQTGRTRFDPAVERRRFLAEARDEEHLSLLEALGYAGEVVVPLRARGRSLGAVTFVRGPGSPPFGDADRRLAEELAGRVALALDNARLLAQSQASEARYRELFEGVADAILVLDPNGVILEINSSGCALLRSERRSLVGHRIGEFAGMEELEAELLAIAGSSAVAEFTIESHVGAPSVVEARAGEVLLPSGTIYLAVLRDVSARQALDRLRRDFLAMVTHDLRSPLAALRAQAQLMQRRGEYNEQRTTAIIGQTDRMARLIDGLADVMRMDAGQLELRRGRVDLRDVVRAAISQELTRVPNRAVSFEAPDPVPGDWDADRLFQVITNLVGNALNYSDADTEVTVSIAQTERDAVVEVRDRGHGIAPEHLDKLFDRFFRAEVTGAGGLGLGLFIARLLVEAHGGTISVKSIVGTGTTFTVRLPKVLDAVAQHA